MRIPRSLGIGILIALVVGPATAARANADDATTKLYDNVIRSVVWIAVPKGKWTISGTGTLIDAERRLILTSYHVVGDGGNCFVLYPMFDRKGKLIAERDAYLSRIQHDQAARAKVLYYREEADLAVIQVESVPADARPLPLAAASVSAGEKIHSFGNPGAAGNAMWLLTEGVVRGVARNKYKSTSSGEPRRDYDIDARVVVAQSPNNPGDSGGPLVNANGELAAVTQGGERNAQEITYFIDIQEIRDFLTKAKILSKDGKLASAAEVKPSPKSTAPPVKPKPPPQEPGPPAVDPNDPNVKQELAAAPTLDLAVSLFKENRFAEATRYFERVVNDYPGTKAAAYAKEQLGKIKDK